MRPNDHQNGLEQPEGGTGTGFVREASWQFLALLFLFSLLAGKHTIAQNGQGLFRNNCASCHKTTEADLVGPGLKGVTERREMEWLLEWTKNSQAMVEKGNEQAVKLYQEYNEQVMPAQDLTDSEIRAIYDFIESGGKKKTAGKGGGQKGDKAGNGREKAELPLAISSKLTLYWLALMALLLVIPSILAVDRALKVLKAEKERSAFR